jgi:ADP-ribose pyrophosphatase YjhB (NUDIX family)
MDQTQPFKPYCAVYTILLKDTKVLLLKRRNQEYPDGYFSLPASHILADESVKTASSRVLAEQTGALVDANKLKFVHTSYRKIADRTYIDLFFEAQYQEYHEDQMENKQPEQYEGLEWFDLQELPENILPHIKTTLIDLDLGVYFREFGWEVAKQNLDE